MFDLISSEIIHKKETNTFPFLFFKLVYFIAVLALFYILFTSFL